MEILNEKRAVRLLNGSLVTLHSLKLVDWNDALSVYGRLLETLVLLSEFETSKEITDEYIEETMPVIIIDLFQTQPDFIKAFFNFFTDEPLDLSTLELDDVVNLWKLIYEVNRRPFTAKRRMMEKLQIFENLKTVDVLNLISYVSSLEQELVTENSEKSPSTLLSESPIQEEVTNEETNLKNPTLLSTPLPQETE